MIPDEGVGWMEGGKGMVSVEGTYTQNLGIVETLGWKVEDGSHTIRITLQCVYACML